MSKKSNKFGNDFKIGNFSINAIKLIIALIVGYVLYKIIMLILKYKNDPGSIFLDLGDWLANQVGKVLRACGTCTPDDDQKKRDPSKKNICGGTGIPFLNLDCAFGLGIVYYLAGILLAGLAKFSKFPA